MTEVNRTQRASRSHFDLYDELTFIRSQLLEAEEMVGIDVTPVGKKSYTTHFIVISITYHHPLPIHIIPPPLLDSIPDQRLPHHPSALHNSNL